MSRLLQGERCGDGPSVRKADLGDAGGFLGSDERGGFARRQGRTRDADSQRGVGRVNTGVSRGVGEWAGLALIALWWGEETGVGEATVAGRTVTVCQEPANTCHRLPSTARHCQFGTRIPRDWSLGRRRGPSLEWWRMSRPTFGLRGPSLGAVVDYGGAGRPGKAGWDLLGTCHRLPYQTRMKSLGQ